ncbi:uncharacterized protein PV09_02775 [Verruconis gallopava]|uniref:CAP-Gly domain-containing protein n=1 Tax=Verruconis gallopava TaxID=253628 RepID=A0A0D2AIA7_9PEZI|nr:uncharacterized protein PV09_02775 [Verruconis gallopava]KIW06310.1 hypothetical protein PV09_02775 [Verruconis gallopava]
MSFKVGQKVQIADGRVGIVRFIGEVSFKEGQWMGLELEDPDGKNDGSVRGERYFDCPPNHGLFIQPSPSIVVLEQPKPAAPTKTNSKPTATSAARPRPSSITSSTSATARSARQSTSGLGEGNVGAKRVSVLPATAKPEARRQTMAPPSTTAARPSRPSIAPRVGALSPKKTSAPSSRPSSVSVSSLANKTAGIRSPPSGASPSPGLDRVLSPGSSSSGSKANQRPTPVAASSTNISSSSAAARVNMNSSKANQENEAKIRILEKKVQELRQKVQELQPQADKVERYDGIIQKLQGKAQAQFAEINELKKQLKESENGFAQIEALQAEHDTNMELAALDREMAEEKAEAYKAELDSIKARAEELALENEILRKENEELSKDMSPEERASQGWMQMQRENSRLRDALIRLRDMTQEQESALKEEIALLEEESEELAKLKEEHDITKTRLLESEAEAEDLREQLEAALGAETMIEQLTEKNLEMTARIEELQNTVEDLENLKELNDEIELSHMEDKKLLQQEIDLKEALLIESAKRVVSQEEELADRDYTIQRFRELVMNMQSDLEDMRSSKELTETQAQELGSHSRAMMDLNRQLQASASNTRVKTIEMELRKLEAQEAAEHLSIVQLFLPEAFQSERDSVLALLRFKRISFKAQLLHGFMKERITSPGPHATADQLLAACDALDKLTWIMAMCERFTSCIATSSLEQFSKFESVLYELEPVERSLNGYIDNLRKDELRDQQVADGLQRAIAVMQHLSELHLHDSPESFANEVLMKTMLMQSNLETTAAALQIMKTEILRAIPASEDGEDSMSAFASKTDALAMQSRSGRVIVGKILRSLQDLKSRCLALTADSDTTFEVGQGMTEDLATTLRSLGTVLYNSIHDEDRATSFTFADLMFVMRNFNKSQDMDVFAPLQAKMKALHERLGDILNVAQDLSNTVEFEQPSPPWVLRSLALAQSKLVSQDAQAEIASLKREIHERGTTIKLRENELEEASVKIELLESRMKDSAKKAARISELEKIIERATTVEKELERKLEEKTLLCVRMEDERDSWMRKAAEMQAQEPMGANGKDKRGAPMGGVHLVGTSQEMEALKSNIKTLESTIRFLRKEMRRTQHEEQRITNAWLSQPLNISDNKNMHALLQKREEARQAFNAIADLPAVAAPVAPGFMKDRNERLKWKPRALTTRYQLYEAEVQWLDAKELMGGERVRSAGPVIVM